MLTLYPDQERLIEKTRHAMRCHKSILIQAATGAGKTVITSFMFLGAIKRGKTAIIVVPRRELMEQTSNTFSKTGIEHGFISSGKKYNPNVKCWIATTESLAKRLDIAPCINMIVVDEAHFGLTANNKIIKKYKDAGAYVFGLSATPCKLSGKGLGCWFDTMVEGESIRWLIDNKRLSDYRLFVPDAPDFSGVKTVAGDYAKGQIADKMERDVVLIGRAVDHYKKHAMGKRNVTFCVSRHHADIVNQAFIKSGIPSEYVDGETSPDERKRIFIALAKGEILNVCNCELLTFGFDLSSAAGMQVTIESLSILKPTKSIALYSQIVGRALRYKPEPALIFDHTGTALRLGLPDEKRFWTLADVDKNARGGKESTVAIRQCEKCDFVHRPAPVCPNCGHEYPYGGRTVNEIEGELKEIKAIEIEKKKLEKKRRRAACKTIEELEHFAREEGYKNPEYWARMFMNIRMRYRNG